MMRTVTVTAEDICGATPWDAANCPVGRAICRTIGHPHIWIPFTMGLGDKPKAAIWGSMWGPFFAVLPDHVAEFLARFECSVDPPPGRERAAAVEPGLTFEIDTSKWRTCTC